MPINVQQVFPSRLEADGKAFSDYAKHYSITPASLNASNAFYIPLDAGSTILDVRVKVLNAFDSGLTFLFGDSGSPSAYFPGSTLTITSANGFYHTQSGSPASPLAKGKYYAATDYLIGTFSGSSAGGKLDLMVLFDGYGTGPDRANVKNLS